MITLSFLKHFDPHTPLSHCKAYTLQLLHFAPFFHSNHTVPLAPDNYVRLIILLTLYLLTATLSLFSCYNVKSQNKGIYFISTVFLEKFYGYSFFNVITFIRTTNKFSFRQELVFHVNRFFYYTFPKTKDTNMQIKPNEEYPWQMLSRSSPCSSKR